MQGRRRLGLGRALLLRQSYFGTRVSSSWGVPSTSSRTLILVGEEPTKNLFRRKFATKQRCSTPMRITKPTMLSENSRIVPVPILSDNYSYLIIDNESNEAAVVDPAEPSTILNAVKREGVSLKAVLTTHHHWDHAGGNEGIVRNLPGLKVYGGDERISSVTDRVGSGSSFKISKNLHADVLFTPCHTSGHVVYLVSDTSNTQGPKALFSGDTLFIGGCGRFFEGTGQDMYEALCVTLAKLPPSTLVFCGHEYTVKNLEFALSIEPDNKALQKKLEWAQETRSCSLGTVPSTLGEEREYNPFMRVGEPSVAAAVGLPGASPVEVMTALRKAKDNWA